MFELLDPAFDDIAPGPLTGPLYAFTYVCDREDRTCYFMAAYPMRRSQSTWWIVPGTIETDVPLDQFEPEAESHDND
jgi:hypothetical protein